MEKIKEYTAGAFGGTYLTNNGQNPSTLSNNEFIGKIYSNNPKEKTCLKKIVM